MYQKTKGTLIFIKMPLNNNYFNLSQNIYLTLENNAKFLAHHLDNLF
jgi:hypothetical protein